jgi:hypothetical protein
MERIGSRRRLRTVGLGQVFAIGGAMVFALAFASPAAGRTTCSYRGSSKRLIVRSSGDDLAQMVRDGNRIVVQKFLEPPVACRGGVATVFNTDTVSVRLKGLFASIDVRLDGGPLAPGATPEAKGASEIEVEVEGSEAMAEVIGTPGPDEFRWAPGGIWAGLNVNPGHRHDNDVDVTARGLDAFIVAEGGRGRDRIVPANRLQRLPGGAFSEGGSGNDVLVASRSGDIIDGGTGKDLIRGGPSFDWVGGGAGKDRISGAGGSDAINPGGGQDVVLAGSGRDFVNSRDSHRDTVKCGGGRDRAKTDPFDRLSSCDQVRAGRAAAGTARAKSNSRLRVSRESRLRRSLRLTRLRRDLRR